MTVTEKIVEKIRDLMSDAAADEMREVRFSNSAKGKRRAGVSSMMEDYNAALREGNRQKAEYVANDLHRTFKDDFTKYEKAYLDALLEEHSFLVHSDEDYWDPKDND